MKKSRKKEIFIEKRDFSLSFSRASVLKNLIKNGKLASQARVLIQHIQASLAKNQIYYLFELKSHEIPVSIFAQSLSPLEALVTYLKDKEGLSFHAIGALLDRNERNIWHSYKKGQLNHVNKERTIPFIIFTNRSLSILEHLVQWLKNDLSNKEIALLLNKDESTIWSVATRAKKKQEKTTTTEGIRALKSLVDELGLTTGLAKKTILKELLLESIYQYFPLEILKYNSPLEAVVLYLKKGLGLKLSEISSLLHRDIRTIWCVYQKVKQDQLHLSRASVLIPLKILATRNVSVLEAVTRHCIDTLLFSFSSTAEKTGRSYKTVYTCYSRAKMKEREVMK